MYATTRFFPLFAATFFFSDFLGLAFAQSTHTVLVSASVPTDASPKIDPSFPGFAFEQAGFYNYSFDSHGNPNTFSQNLIQSVLDRTGGTPLIRVGGTSGDRAHFNSSQDTAINYPATEYGVHFHAPYLCVGSKYFDAFKNFPGAQYEFQVPWNQWEDGPHQPNSLEWSEAGLDAIGIERLYSLELGNEPDYYSRFSHKHGAMKRSKYVDYYQYFRNALKRKFESLQDKRIFQALDIASAQADHLPTSAAFRLGLSKVADSIKQVAYHYYQGNGIDSFSALQHWILHSKTVQQMEVFKNDIEFLRQEQFDIGFALDEVGDNVGTGAVQGAISNCFATALWRVDFQLHAMAIGVSRINFQQIFGPRSSMWLPVKSDKAGLPRVTTNYYAMPFAAEFIGDSGETKVAPLEINDDAGGKLVAYGAYDYGKLARIAVLNLHMWRPLDGHRHHRIVSIDGLPEHATHASMHHLAAPDGALAKHGITWRGLQWTFESKGTEQRVKDDSVRLNITDRMLELELNATSAVMIEL